MRSERLKEFMLLHLLCTMLERIPITPKLEQYCDNEVDIRNQRDLDYVGILCIISKVPKFPVYSVHRSLNTVIEFT